MRALLTGATGFIGSHLARRLIARGDIVHALVRPDSDIAALDPAIGIHRSDGAIGSLCDSLAHVAPDVVFHLASRFQDRHKPDDVAELIQSNIGFGAALAEAMLHADCRRLINTGTAWQHFDGAGYAPVCLYAATKQAFEDVLRYYVDVGGLHVITLKLFDTYGPGDRRAKLLSRFARMARDGDTLDMSPGEQRVDLVHVDDVADAFVIAAERLLAGQTGMANYAVSSGAPIGLRDLAGAFEIATGQTLSINWGGRPYRPREIMQPWSGGASLPGWSPRIALNDGLRGGVD